MKLIATDVDGTLLRSDHTISERTRAAFAAAQEAGVRVVAISGRQPYSIGAIVKGSALMGPAVGSNGATITDLRSREVLMAKTLEVEVQRSLVAGLERSFPALTVMAVRDGGDSYVAEHAYPGIDDAFAAQALWEVSYEHADRDEVLGRPCGKLVVRDEDATPAQLLAAARDLDLPGLHATTSGAPFLEVGPDQVTKAAALRWLCQRWDIAPDDVVAFGDNLNDVEMLSFAGRGVAMSNAEPEAKEVADQVTASNDDDGVAVVIESLL